MIREATNEDMPKVRALFREYQEWLNIDLCFQGFEEELAALPGAYAPSKGAIFLAIAEEEVIGCVGIRPRKEISGEAELKRLYVKPAYHGQGIGRRLFHTAMAKAKNIGYESIVLDTLPTMHEAKSLYKSYGFKEIPEYYSNPEEGAEYYRYTFS